MSAYTKPPDVGSVDLSDYLVIVAELEKQKERLRILRAELKLTHTRLSVAQDKARAAA